MDKFTVCCWIFQFVVLALVCTSVYVMYVVMPKAESLALKQFHCFEVISYEAMAFVFAAFVAGMQFYEGLIVSPILLCIQCVILIAAIVCMVRAHRKYGKAIEEEKNGTKMPS